VSATTLKGSRVKAVLQALLVTFLWSTSWVLIKIGLRASLPAITFAGLRYGLAFLCLAPLALSRPATRVAMRRLPLSLWMQLGLLGVLFYALTQGAQFLSLAYLPAATVSLLLNLSPVAVLLLGSVLIDERPSLAQIAGVALSVGGAALYFFPLELPTDQMFGLAVALVGVLANAGSSLLGRRVNRGGVLDPLLVTLVSMGVGAAILLAVGITVQGFGQLRALDWAIIGWLAVVNTALAFTLWNRTLRTLTAVESSVINNTMLPQTVILAWLFLGESLGEKQIVGLVLAGIGALVVQLRARGGATSG
jgi:drug/metabolite transporter (DMT)-like permease